MALTLEQIDPQNFIFIPSKNLIEMFEDLKAQIEDYKNVNNEYVQIKMQEEKIKTKKAKKEVPIEEENKNENGLISFTTGGQ